MLGLIGLLLRAAETSLNGRRRIRFGLTNLGLPYLDLPYQGRTLLLDDVGIMDWSVVPLRVPMPLASA